MCDFRVWKLKLLSFQLIEKFLLKTQNSAFWVWSLHLFLHLCTSIEYYGINYVVNINLWTKKQWKSCWNTFAFSSNLKMQLHAVNTCWKRLSQHSLSKRGVKMWTFVYFERFNSTLEIINMKKSVSRRKSIFMTSFPYWWFRPVFSAGFLKVEIPQSRSCCQYCCCCYCCCCCLPIFKGEMLKTGKDQLLIDKVHCVFLINVVVVVVL